MRQRLVALVAVTFIATVMGAFAFAAPGNASTTVIGPCVLPTEKVAQVQAQDVVDSIQARACLDITFTDKCDGNTVVKMSNGAFNDNKFTVLTVSLKGTEYKLKGGSDPNVVEVTVGPKISDLQPYLVFRFTAPNGDEIVITKAYGDPWTWKLPDACPTASPTPSVSPSAPVTSAPASTTPPVAVGSNDLPVTGASLTAWFGSGAALLAAAAGLGVYLRRRRNSFTS